MKTLVAHYRDVADAQQVIEALIEAGFPANSLSLLIRAKEEIETNVSPVEGARFGAVIGTLIGLGSLLAGITPVGGDALAAALSAGLSAATGALTGGIAAEVIDRVEGSPEYVRQQRRSTVSLTTQEAWLEWAYRIMARCDPLKIEQRPAKHYPSRGTILNFFDLSDDRRFARDSSSTSLPIL